MSEKLISRRDFSISVLSVGIIGSLSGCSSPDDKTVAPTETPTTTDELDIGETNMTTNNNTTEETKTEETTTEILTIGETQEPEGVSITSIEEYSYVTENKEEWVGKSITVPSATVSGPWGSDYTVVLDFEEEKRPYFLKNITEQDILDISSNGTVQFSGEIERFEYMQGIPVIFVESVELSSV